jgi:hypothetical protein
MATVDFRKNAHLAYGDFVEPLQALRLEINSGRNELYASIFC